MEQVKPSATSPTNTQAPAPQQAQQAQPPQGLPINQAIFMQINYFGKFLKDAEMILDGNHTDFAGLARAKLQEANFWGNKAMLESGRVAPPQMATQQQPAPVAPIVTPTAPIATGEAATPPADTSPQQQASNG